MEKGEKMGNMAKNMRLMGHGGGKDPRHIMCVSVSLGGRRDVRKEKKSER